MLLLGAVCALAPRAEFHFRMRRGLAAGLTIGAYDCEQKLVKKGLPNMIEAASSPELQTGLEQHLEETRGQVIRLERVFSSINSEANTESDDVLDELTSLTKDLVGDSHSGSARCCPHPEGEQSRTPRWHSMDRWWLMHNRPVCKMQLQSFSKPYKKKKAADAKLTRLGESSINAIA